ncbi:MAG: hypothetical protein LKE39_01690 [Sphaerochaeta sp.]|jgi:hypothetical protein|nr:hypothetical protein [Sphaerochaeta sp.]MCI2128544.1 hypothetical protein [Sphaerochaeta sp.]
MRNLFETAFYLVYLVIVMTTGSVMVRRCHGRKQYWLFAVASLLLGTGDAMYLLPRAYALSMGNLETNAWVSGIGMLVALLSHVTFFVLLYYVARLRYRIQGHIPFMVCVYICAGATFVLHVLPQNHWITRSPSWTIGIVRAIPYIALGVLVCIFFAIESKKANDQHFHWMSLAIACNYACYIPVVIWIRYAPSLWVLMIPQAVTFVWIITIGFRAMSGEAK